MNSTNTAKSKSPNENNDELYASVSYAPVKDRGSIVRWDRPALPQPSAAIELVEPFNARGMQCVYGRGDHFGGRQPVLHLDMWKTKDGRLLARFWSRGSEVDNESHAVHWESQTEYAPQDEQWVPEVLRTAYDNWVVSSLNFAGGV